MNLKKKVKATDDIPTGSMADIVFLLIIFFLVTTTMNKDKGLGLVLPPEGDAIEINKKNMCNVSIAPNGSVLISDFTGDVTVSPNEYRKVFQEIKGRLEINSKLIVSIKANEGAEYQYFIQVLDKIKQSFQETGSPEKISIANYTR